MIHFPNKTLHRYTYTGEAEDVYGAPVKEYEYSNDFVVDFQPERSQEVRAQYGVETDNLYKIYFRKQDALEASDELEDSDGHRYSIIGDIQEYDHFLDFKKAHLIDKRCQ